MPKNKKTTKPTGSVDSTRFTALKRRITAVNPLVALVVVLAVLVAVFFVPLPHTQTRQVEVPFGTERIKDEALELGKQSTKQSGQDGAKEVTYKSYRSIFDLLFRKESISEKKVSETITKESKVAIVAEGTKNTQPAASVPASNTTTNNVAPTKTVNCPEAYYKNTAVYQEWWRKHLDTTNGYIQQVHSQDFLSADEKKVQINRWENYFNDRVNELVANWKQSMQASGCGSTPMGFSPGYMPITQ